MAKDDSSESDFVEERRLLQGHAFAMSTNP